MAEVVAQMPGRGRIEWDRYLDGQVWKLTCGVDFAHNQMSFIRNLAYMAGRARHRQVKVNIKGDVIFIQAVGPLALASLKSED